MEDRKTEEELAALREAFREFGALTERLQSSHDELTRRVKELTEEQALILEGITDGVLATDSSGRLAVVNRAAAQILGLRAEELRGRGVSAALAGGVAPLARLLEETLSRPDKSIGTEAIVKTPDGRELVLSASTAPLRDQAGRVAGAVQCFRDLTTLKELERRLERKDRLEALGEMAAGVAHEIRNPLGGIRLYASLLERELADRPEARRTVGKVISGVDHLNRIVEDLLAFTKEIVPEPRAMDLREVVEQALELAAPKIDSSGARVLRRLPAGRVGVVADPGLLMRVFLNLIINAAEAMPEGGELTVSVRRPAAGETTVEVADTGPGIAPEKARKIFNPFFSDKPGGTGLGLAIAHRIVEAHGGEISFANRFSGGAIFTVTLPSGEGRG